MSPSNINSPSILVNPLGFTSVISSAPASISPINKTSDITMNLEINPLSNDNASINHSHRDYIGVVSKIFKYDSSLNINSIDDLIVF